MEYKEEFRIVEYKGYKFKVSNYGYCSVETKKIDGYMKTKGYKNIGVHILVAKAFPEICGEWFEGCVVHHINRVKNDNCAWNLVILSTKEHSDRHKEDKEKNECQYIIKNHIGKIVKYDLYWNPIKTYNNAVEISYEIPFCVETIRKAIKNGNLLGGYYYVKIR